jgi:hypothetical protein
MTLNCILSVQLLVKLRCCRHASLPSKAQSQSRQLGYEL